jgi:hypothetical protein
MDTIKRQYIENPRNYPNEDVGRLEILLKSDAPLRVDPRRSNFYEVDDDDRVFYIYISPTTGTVTFLANWVQEFGPAVVA